MLTPMLHSRGVRAAVYYFRDRYVLNKMSKMNQKANLEVHIWPLYVADPQHTYDRYISQFERLFGNTHEHLPKNFVFLMSPLKRDCLRSVAISLCRPASSEKVIRNSTGTGNRTLDLSTYKSYAFGSFCFWDSRMQIHSLLVDLIIDHNYGSQPCHSSEVRTPIVPESLHTRRRVRTALWKTMTRVSTCLNLCFIDYSPKEDIFNALERLMNPWVGLLMILCGI